MCIIDCGEKDTEQNIGRDGLDLYGKERIVKDRLDDVKDEEHIEKEHIKSPRRGKFLVVWRTSC